MRQVIASWSGHRVIGATQSISEHQSIRASEHQSIRACPTRHAHQTVAQSDGMRAREHGSRGESEDLSKQALHKQTIRDAGCEEQTCGRRWQRTPRAKSRPRGAAACALPSAPPLSQTQARYRTQDEVAWVIDNPHGLACSGQATGYCSFPPWCVARLGHRSYSVNRNQEATIAAI
eukprot:3432875-Rhodomonas_salina.1